MGIYCSQTEYYLYKSNKLSGLICFETGNDHLILLQHIKSLFELSGNKIELAINYSKAITKLIFNPSEFFTNQEEAISMLMELNDIYPKNESIQKEYATCLVRMCFNYQGFDKQRWVDQLENLTTCYPSNSDLAVYFARALFNMFFEVDEMRKIKIIGILQEQLLKHPGNEDVAQIYAKALINMCDEANGNYVFSCIDKLKKLNQAFSTSNKVAKEYSRGINILYNIINIDKAELTNKLSCE